MRTLLLTLTLAASMFHPVVSAEEAIDSEALAQLDALLARCATVDEKNEANIKQLREGILADMAPGELSAVRGGERYLRARKAADSDVAKSDRQQVRSMCKMLADSQKPAP